MKVLLLTDSVALPRKHKNGEVQWQDIYFSKLQQHFNEHEFILVGMGGATIQQLRAALNYYVLVKPDLIILQSGIVDCAPRALGQLELEVIKKLHLFRLIKPMTQFLRKHRNIAYSSPKIFEQTLVKIKNTFPGKPLIGIGILPGCEDYDKITPGISKRINLYNSIIEKHTEYINNNDFPREGIIQDFHHINEVGHKVIFEKLKPLVQKFLNVQKLTADV